MRGRPFATPAWARHLETLRCVVRGDVVDGSDDGFPSYAAEQHVAHYVLGRLGDRTPGAWAPALRAEVSRRAAIESGIPAATAEAVGALSAKRVESRVLKGPAFAARYYGDASWRRSVDVDLLVRERDADRALRVLLGLGYRARPRRLARGPSIRRGWLKTEHALALERDGVPLDLHWRLRAAAAYRIDERDVWREARGDGLSDEYALVLLLLSIAHDVARRGCRMKHLLDVLLLVRSAPIEWPAFFERRRAENVLGICVNVLGLVLDAFDARGEIPELARHEALRVPTDPLTLVHKSRGIASVAWWLRVYPADWPRDLQWWIQRNLAHPGRLYLQVYRGIHLGVRSLRHRLQGESWVRGA